MDEDRSFFANKIGDQHNETKKMTPVRESEWLASRYLAFIVDGLLPKDIVKDEFGNPYCESGQVQFSISHSKMYAAYASHHDPIGIDVQILDERVKKIAPKFTSEEELNHLPENISEEDKNHLIWTVKEAVFKLYGRKELPFKTGILIKESACTGNKIFSKGEVRKPNFHRPFQAWTMKGPDYFYSSAKYLE
jgi:phosphopantetheinyl transferase